VNDSKAALIARAVFRSSPSRELVLLDRLPRHDRNALGAIAEQPEIFGVLRSLRPGENRWLAVTRDTALLLFALREPGRLPAYVTNASDPRWPREIVQLVMDGALEVEIGGEFLSGSSAVAWLGATHRVHPVDGALARLSERAVQYAQALETDDVQDLAGRLYAFNSLPLSPKWLTLYPSAADVAELLEVQRGGRCSRLLGAAWQQAPSAQSEGAWLMWQSRSAAAYGRRRHAAFKLYVSPPPDEMREVFRIVVDALDKTRPSAFKVGADLRGLLRPDKLVLYFGSIDELQGAANCLTGKLHRHDAHGVPFTSEIAGNGILSWGTDPVPDADVAPAEQESWRLWVAKRLACYLVAARREQTTDTEPWRFALARLQMDGVDTSTWTPSLSIWRRDLPLHLGAQA